MERSVDTAPCQAAACAAGCALFGYAASRLGFESAPLLLGFVLGRLLEEMGDAAKSIAGSAPSRIH